jgi:hypothetical protein
LFCFCLLNLILHHLEFYTSQPLTKQKLRSRCSTNKWTRKRFILAGRLSSCWSRDKIQVYYGCKKSIQ